MKELIVVGAGVSGLTLAERFSDRDIMVLEQSSTLGGSLRTLRKDGYQIELGANSLLLRNSGRELLKRLGLRAIVVPKTKMTRYLALPVSGIDELVEVPLNPLSFIRSPILSASGKLRLFGEPFANKHLADDVSVQQFITGRLGSEVATRMIAPIFSGIYASDISKLSARTALGSLYQFEQEHGSILLGAIRRKKPAKKRGKMEMANLPGGMSDLIDTLAHRLGDKLRTDSTVQSIDLSQRPYRITGSFGEIETNRLVITTDALTTARLIGGDLVEPLCSLPYSPVGLLYLSIDNSVPLNGVGFLCQPKAGRALLGALFTSTSFPHTAPSNRQLLTCFVGGALNPKLADATQPEIQQQVLSELSHFLPAKPEIVHSIFWPRAIPSYPVGHYKLEEKVKELESKHPGLRFLANWIEKPGVADCIERTEEYQWDA